MGQRLVISVYNNGELLANAYYHWSGYTRSANHLLSQMINELKKEDSYLHSIESPVLKAIRLLEETGAKLTDHKGDINEFGAARELFPTEGFATAESRNDGLISITEAGMTDTQGWSEGNASIDIGTLTVTNDCFYIYYNKEEYIAECFDDEESSEEEFKESVFVGDCVDSGELTFDQFFEWDAFCDEIINQGFYNYQDGEGQIISFIE